MFSLSDYDFFGAHVRMEPPEADTGDPEMIAFWAVSMADWARKAWRSLVENGMRHPFTVRYCQEFANSEKYYRRSLRAHLDAHDAAAPRRFPL